MKAVAACLLWRNQMAAQDAMIFDKMPCIIAEIRKFVIRRFGARRRRLPLSCISVKRVGQRSRIHSVGL
ncbi:MAG TPA: hypothetical protein VGX92_22065 [Pyrinomonadaceae bacterium]|nr:hypothetical protein [Pyrinomonadaceae bacterium]